MQRAGCRARPSRLTSEASLSIGSQIDGSDIGTLEKTTLKAGLQQAQDNPELLQGLLEQIKTALGM